MPAEAQHASVPRRPRGASSASAHRQSSTPRHSRDGGNPGPQRADREADREGQHSLDTVSLRGIVLYGYHGVRPEERTLGQRFVVDVDMQADLRDAAASDALDRTVDYSQVYARVAQIVNGEPVDLLETLGDRIARAVFADFPQVRSAKVRIAKPGVAIPGAALREAAVTIRRQRPDDTA